jgi:hypothetical protein
LNNLLHLFNTIGAGKKIPRKMLFTISSFRLHFFITHRQYFGRKHIEDFVLSFLQRSHYRKSLNFLIFYFKPTSFNVFPLHSVKMIFSARLNIRHIENKPSVMSKVIFDKFFEFVLKLFSASERVIL